jgi:hypothetical protein
LLAIKLLFSDPLDVRLVPMLRDSLVTGRIVIGFVQAQVLRGFLCDLGTVDHNGVQRGTQQFSVVHIGCCHDNGQRATCALDE